MSDTLLSCVIFMSRLRDLSNQEKLENQRLVKDFDKQVSSLAAMKELKDRFEEELKVPILLRACCNILLLHVCRKRIHLLMN